MTGLPGRVEPNERSPGLSEPALRALARFWSTPDGEVVAVELRRIAALPGHAETTLLALKFQDGGRGMIDQLLGANRRLAAMERAGAPASSKDEDAVW